MIMRDNGEVMTESEDDSDGMPPELVDASDDDGVVYPMTGESLVVTAQNRTKEIIIIIIIIIRQKKYLENPYPHLTFSTYPTRPHHSLFFF